MEKIASGDIPLGRVVRGAAAGGVWLHDAGRQGPMSGAHRHVEWEVNLVVRGWAEYAVDGVRQRWPTDTLAWLMPEQGHLLIERSASLQMWVGVFREPLARRAVRRVGEGVVGVAGAGAGRGLPGPRLLNESAALKLGSMFAWAADGSVPRGHHTAVLSVLVGECVMQGRAAADLPAGSHLHPAVERAAWRLHEETGDSEGRGMGLEALARQCSMSRPHLSRLFKQQLGMTLTAYRNRCRVARFEAALGRGRRVNKTEAARIAGFGSYAQAYRVVKELTGRSPREMTRD